MKIITSLLLSLLAFNMNGASASTEKIKVANEGFEFPPFYFFQNSSGGSMKKTGFEIDLIQVILKKNNLNYSLIQTYEGIGEKTNLNMPEKGPIDFKDLLPGLYAKTSKGFAWDLVTATFGITEERKKNYDFSNPIYIATKHFFGNPNKIQINTIPDDLVGLSIAVEANTLFEAYVRNLNLMLEKKLGNKESIKVIPVSANASGSPIENVFNMVISGKADLTVTDDEVYLAKKEKDQIKFSQIGMIGTEIMSTSGSGGEKFGNGVGIAMRKGSSLKLMIDKTVKEMLRDCSYQTIYKKYFKIPSPLVSKNCK